MTEIGYVSAHLMIVIMFLACIGFMVKLKKARGAEVPRGLLLNGLIAWAIFYGLVRGAVVIAYMAWEALS